VLPSLSIRDERRPIFLQKGRSSNHHDQDQLFTHTHLRLLHEGSFVRHVAGTRFRIGMLRGFSVSAARFHATALSPSSPLPLARPLAMAHATVTCSVLLPLLPLLSLLSTHRPVSSAHDVPSHASPSRSPCPSSFMRLPAMPLNGVRCIYHAWSQAVACTGCDESLISSVSL
jgi:hypothetical protein